MNIWKGVGLFFIGVSISAYVAFAKAYRKACFAELAAKSAMDLADMYAAACISGDEQLMRNHEAIKCKIRELIEK